jgi:hypothetical protein
VRRPLALIPAVMLVLTQVSFAHADDAATTSAPPRWTLVASPRPGTQSSLADVAALSPTDAWAVGTWVEDSGGPYKTLIEHWDGSGWSVVPSPNPSAGVSALNTVEAVSPTDIWAAGIHDNRSLLEHWDGVSWTAIEGPQLPERTNGSQVWDLTRVPGTSNLWGVGSRTVTRSSSVSMTEPLVIHLHGSTWKKVPSRTDARGPVLYGVAAADGAHAVAVGSQRAEGGRMKPFSQHWDGSDWTTALTTNPVTGGRSALLAISRVPGSQAMWAVGYGKGGNAAIAEYWDGSVWSTVATPPPVSIHGNGRSWFDGVVALGSNKAWAVGSVRFHGQGLGQDTLIEWWDGTTWEVVASPNQGSINSLFAVARVPGTAQAWAVGSSFEGSTTSGLIEHFG